MNKNDFLLQHNHLNTLWVTTLLVCLFQSAPAIAQVSLPSFFSDNMVLQQDETVAIWGTDIPNTVIVIETSWGEKIDTRSDSDGYWKTKINTTKASFTPHQLTITGSSVQTLKNVLLGEVWFCSGQSNMEMPMKGLGNSPVNGANEFILNAKNPNIRLFNTERAGSLSPENDVIGSWEEANGASVSNFSAIGYLFGKKLWEQLNIPIGIIESSWGGTRIEAWLPEDALLNYSEVNLSKTLNEDPNRRKQPTQIFNAMIHPFQDFNIKGYLWYQGESNRTNPEPYKKYMHNLVNTWRSQWNNKDLPFYFVQIAPYAYEQFRQTNATNADLIRESQLLASLEIPNSGLVVTSDVGKCDDIHPPEKETIADRLAYWALAKQYGYDQIHFAAPVYDFMAVNKNTVELSFKSIQDNDKVRLSSFRQALTGFTIAGTDKVFYPAEASLNNNGTISLKSSKVPNPVAARYGFEDCFKATLYNLAKIPVSPFRTDSW
ncbi:sialate O-acetylesterase [Maribacter sp. R77961]|uniref:sialate O-acetylesterase n=1 Tax=Maribacter sp. R77961 TaxID=3093871 RepID=UPI0037C79B95